MIKFPRRPEWRNWQTHKTQNLGLLREREGSTPSSGTKKDFEVSCGFYSKFNGGSLFRELLSSYPFGSEGWKGLK